MEATNSLNHDHIMRFELAKRMEAKFIHEPFEESEYQRRMNKMSS